MPMPPLHNTHGSLNFETANLAVDAVGEALLKRISEEERSDLFGTAVDSVRVAMLNGCPTVFYGMSDENLAKWASIGGLTTRIPNTVTIIHLKLEKSTVGTLA